jgi:pimeloyl-ACP methyl ester carboxylesterase/DNA-binding winged helix-turn-helix (wHTH) protein
MILRFADCELDLERCELRRLGEVRHVEPQVFDLLAHLVRHRDRLVTRDELLDAIWGHRFVTPGTLSSRLKALRQAVGDDGEAQRVVKTVRGRGFRFVAHVTDTELPTAAAPSPQRSKAHGAGDGLDAEPARIREQRIRFCRAYDGVQIAYATCGSGPPLVKTANWLSHLEYDWVSPVWRHWLTELSSRHTLIRYDERGCGLSDWDADDLSFESWVRDLETVVDTMGLERFPMLGISQGAAVAVAYAAKHPDRVTRLVLYGSFAQGWKGRGDADLDLFEQMLPLGWGRDNPAFRQFFAKLFLPEGTDEQIRWFSDLQRSSSTAEGGARLFDTIGRIDVVEEASKIKVPTLLLHASADAVIAFAAGRKLASIIPDATFVPLWGRNHILLEGEPAWVRFVDEVRTFLADDAPVGDTPALDE